MTESLYEICFVGGSVVLWCFGFFSLLLLLWGMLVYNILYGGETQETFIHSCHAS